MIPTESHGLEHRGVDVRRTYEDAARGASAAVLSSASTYFFVGSALASVLRKMAKMTICKSE